MGNNQKRPSHSQRTCARAPFASPRLEPALERHKRILQNRRTRCKVFPPGTCNTQRTRSTHGAPGSFLETPDRPPLNGVRPGNRVGAADGFQGSATRERPVIPYLVPAFHSKIICHVKPKARDMEGSTGVHCISRRHSAWRHQRAQFHGTAGCTSRGAGESGGHSEMTSLSLDFFDCICVCDVVQGSCPTRGPAVTTSKHSTLSVGCFDRACCAALVRANGRRVRVRGGGACAEPAEPGAASGRRRCCRC